MKIRTITAPQEIKIGSKVRINGTYKDNINYIASEKRTDSAGKVYFVNTPNRSSFPEERWVWTVLQILEERDSCLLTAQNGQFDPIFILMKKEELVIYESDIQVVTEDKPINRMDNLE